MHEINTILQELPYTIKSYVVSNSDLSYTVVLNSRLSHEQNFISYQHELEHIHNGDYEKKCSIDLIELHAHQIM